MSSHLRLVKAISWALSFLTFALAQEVKLVFPPAGQSTSDLIFPVGQDVPLQWTCTFPIFTLQVWQGPDDDGTKAFQNILSECEIVQEWL